ncbi:MAG: CRISPR-associated protein Cas2 [Euryhalocaulis sp.]|uniref:hypothetical protein n=1 Tax=Euryhalocaulis sp. TaxID=2744307 RepID=UPI00184BAF9F|nr:hypothetical protein [Euryhalocaulis sp.]MBA4801509.1 CRISPR-associated protein Cas2 [Euryhalocaulis sp.]
MADYIVAYDLNKVGQNYKCITGKLENLPHCHAQGSVWFVNYSGSAADLRDDLKDCLDNNDSLFVGKVGSWASWKMKCANWLNR